VPRLFTRFSDTGGPHGSEQAKDPYVREAYNTHGRQVNEALELVKKQRQATFTQALVKFMTFGKVDRRAPIGDTTATQTMWSLFGDELVAESIPPEDVIGCIQVHRINFRDIGTDEMKENGICYRLVDPVYRNPCCTLPYEILEAGISFLEDELANHQNGKTKTVRDGFVQSEKK
jgi:hypothetical protein